MERKFTHTLMKWKNKKDKMPMIVVGARQVGKTYIIQKFCNENYRKVCYIDLFEDKRLINWFKNLETFEQKKKF